MRAVPSLTRPLRIGAGYGAFHRGDKYEIVRLPYGEFGKISIMSMPPNPDKAQRVLDWFVEHDLEFQVLLLTTPPDEPVDLSSLVLRCVRSSLVS